MMKKVISIVLSIIMIASLFVVNMNVFADDEIKILINDKKQAYDVMPRIINGRTLVPLRGIFEALGAEIIWDDATKTVTAAKGSTKVVLSIGNTEAKINDNTVLLDVPASIISSRTMVPARFVAESLGCRVDWDGNTRTVIINSSKGMAELISDFHRPVPSEFEKSKDLNDYYHFERESIEEQEAKYAEVKKDGTVVCSEEDFLEGAKLQGAKNYGSFEVYDAVDMPFKKIVSLKCTKIPEKDSLLILKTSASTEKVEGEGVAKDEQMLIAFRFRLKDGGVNDIGTIKVQVEHPVTFKKAIFTEVTADKEWKIVYLPYKGKDTTSVGIRFGYSLQTIELGGIEVLNFGKDYDASKLPYTAEVCAGLEKEEQWRIDALERIEKIRKGDFAVVVKDKDGNPVANAEVELDMFEHEFQFGNVINGTAKTNDTYRQKFSELFNTAVLETSMKWAPYEANKASSRELVNVAKELGVKNMRGHVLFWERQYGSDKKTNMTPDYMYAEDIKGNKEKIEELCNAHIDDICNAFKGEISDWDVINEIIDNDDIRVAYGSDELFNKWFERTRQVVGEECDLYYNEAYMFDGRLQEKVQKLCDLGVDFDGIGLQSHLDSTKYGPYDVLNLYDSLRKFGKRIKVTEYSNSTPDPKLQGNYIRDMMIIAFAEEMCDGFVMWGFKDGASYAAYSPLFYKDWSEKPGVLVYKDLVYNKWWTRDAKATTDAEGRATVRGFYGDYDVTVSANGKTKTVMAAYHKGYNNTLEVVLD